MKLRYILSAWLLGWFLIFEAQNFDGVIPVMLGVHAIGLMMYAFIASICVAVLHFDDERPVKW